MIAMGLAVAEVESTDGQCARLRWRGIDLDQEAQRQPSPLIHFNNARCHWPVQAPMLDRSRRCT